MLARYAGTLAVALLVSGLAPVPSEAAKTIAAAGDIACDPASRYFNYGLGRGDYCRQRDTSRLLAGADRVLPLGDLQYEHGTLRRIRASYDRSWGNYFSITRPAIGNHEFGTEDDKRIDLAQGYYNYWGWRAGPRGRGYYSYNLGDWHMVVLNSVCWSVGGCGRGSPQERWLRRDLAANRDKKCTLAYYHHPNFTSGQSGTKFRRTLKPFWDALMDARAEVVLYGHDHVYERFAPQTSSGSPSRFGPRAFMAGTGGKNHGRFPYRRANSVVRLREHGVLRMRLDSGRFEWRFASPFTSRSLDHGSARCQ